MNSYMANCATNTSTLPGIILSKEDVERVSGAGILAAAAVAGAVVGVFMAAEGAGEKVGRLLYYATH